MQVGIGAFVVNSKREVLVVQERFGPLKGSVSGICHVPIHTVASLLTQYGTTITLAYLAMCSSVPVHSFTTGHAICHTKYIQACLRDNRQCKPTKILHAWQHFVLLLC